jgi:hypothetical protein
MDALYPWQAPYLEAVCETDDSLMEGRILEARAALEQRLLSPVEGEEYRAIKCTEKALEVLRAERVHKATLTAADANFPSTSSQSTL